MFLLSNPKLNCFSVLCSLEAVIWTVSLVLISNLTKVSATNPAMNTNQTQSTNTSNIQTRSPPPAKSLFNSQLFQSDNILGGVMKTFVNSLPLRESYIAFEQAHPGGDESNSQEFDQYFKPSKFPPSYGYDQPSSSSYFSKLQNSYSYSPQPPPPTYYHPQHQHHQHSSYYHPFSPGPPPPPPPPPQPFLRLVKIPGDLKIIVSGGDRNDLEVICEFPPYLLTVQQIYWHVIPPPASLLLPYGTFYDSRNGFAPRVTVTSVSKWKSVLRVRDYTPDDYGTYRCVSTAILPEEPEPTYSVQLPRLPPVPPTSYYYPHRDSLELRSAASMLSARQIGNDMSKEDRDTMASGSTKRESKIKFLRRKREIGAFGVHAPFFKPEYGVYRVFKEIKFYGEPFGLGSEMVSNTLNSPESIEKGTGSGGSVSSSNNGKGGSRESREESEQRKNGGRRFDLFTRKSKVLF